MITLTYNFLFTVSSHKVSEFLGYIKVASLTQILKCVRSVVWNSSQSFHFLTYVVLELNPMAGPARLVLAVLAAK